MNTLDQLPTPSHGWRPDSPDPRDFHFVAPAAIRKSLPASVDLRAKCPPVVVQGNINSCTACVAAAAFTFDQSKQGLSDIFDPSRLYIYYNERVLENSVGSNASVSLRSAMQAITQNGVCPEPMWPYDTTKFTEKPPEECYTAAAAHKGLTYQRLVQSNQELKACLASGLPFCLGIQIFPSFVSREPGGPGATGIIPMPLPTEAPLFGHALLAVGYDDSSARFIARNSWGSGWGMGGYCTIPYAYFDSNLTMDFWVLQTVE